MPAWITPAFSTLNWTSPPLAPFDGGFDVHRHGAHFRVRHQVARAEDLAQTANQRHQVRRCDATVELDLAGLNGLPSGLRRQRYPAPAALASSALAPRANTATRTVLPVPFGSCHHAADHLVSVARVNAQVHRDFDGFVELGRGRALDQLDRIFNGDVGLAGEELPSPWRRALQLFAMMISPSLRCRRTVAEPRMIFIAASTEFAFRSFILVSAILRS